MAFPRLVHMWSTTHYAFVTCARGGDRLAPWIHGLAPEYVYGPLGMIVSPICHAPSGIPPKPLRNNSQPQSRIFWCSTLLIQESIPLEYPPPSPYPPVGGGGGSLRLLAPPESTVPTPGICMGGVCGEPPYVPRTTVFHLPHNGGR